jgi:hypothetical protein
LEATEHRQIAAFVQAQAAAIPPLLSFAGDGHLLPIHRAREDRLGKATQQDQPQQEPADGAKDSLHAATALL